MRRRRGMISLALILVFSSLIAVIGAALMYVGNKAEQELIARSALAAQYATESGANLALAKVKQSELEKQTLRISFEGTTAIVRIKDIKKEKDGTSSAVIVSIGRDTKNGRERYLRLTIKKDEDGGIHVTRIGSRK